MYFLIRTFRDPIYDGKIPSATLLGGAFGLSRWPCS